MTPILRPSTETELAKAGGWVVNLALGLILLGGGGVLLYWEMKVPPAHTIHVCVYAGIGLLGALVIRPDPIIGGIQRLVGVLGKTNLPFIGGKKP